MTRLIDNAIIGCIGLVLIVGLFVVFVLLIRVLVYIIKHFNDIGEEWF